jgi:Uma2 family endonuclease
LLVIEVSDTTLRYDRDVKAPLYARHGVPEFWIIDVQNAQLLVYREPRDGRYEKHSALSRPASAPITAVHGVTIDLKGLFGP